MVNERYIIDRMIEISVSLFFLYDYVIFIYQLLIINE